MQQGWPCADHVPELNMGPAPLHDDNNLHVNGCVQASSVTWTTDMCARRALFNPIVLTILDSFPGVLVHAWAMQPWIGRISRVHVQKQRKTTSPSRQEPDQYIAAARLQGLPKPNNAWNFTVITSFIFVEKTYKTRTNSHIPKWRWLLIWKLKSYSRREII